MKKMCSTAKKFEKAVGTSQLVMNAIGIAMGIAAIKQVLSMFVLLEELSWYDLRDEGQGILDQIMAEQIENKIELEQNRMRRD